MELLKFFIKDEVPAVGLTRFKGRKNYPRLEDIPVNLKPNVFKPNYNENFFLL